MLVSPELFKFRAQFTNGTTGLVKDHRDRTLTCMTHSEAIKVAKNIARRNDVQAVKLLTIPNRER